MQHDLFIEIYLRQQFTHSDAPFGMRAPTCRVRSAARARRKGRDRTSRQDESNYEALWVIEMVVEGQAGNLAGAAGADLRRLLQAGRSLSPPQDGVGLGLAISRESLMR